MNQLITVEKIITLAYFLWRVCRKPLLKGMVALLYFIAGKVGSWEVQHYLEHHYGKKPTRDKA